MCGRQVVLQIGYGFVERVWFWLGFIIDGFCEFLDIQVNLVFKGVG